MEAYGFPEAGGDLFQRSGKVVESMEKAKYQTGCPVHLSNPSGEWRAQMLETE